MSVPAAPTIPARKQAFLTAQTNLLSQPLEPSRNWRAANGASEAPLPARQVEDVLFNLNHALQQHCRRVYAPQASRNVAEQISRSYTRDAERRAGETVNGTVGRQADLADETVIESLPRQWPSAKQRDADPEAAQQYAVAAQRLVQLDEERKQIRQRVDKLKGLQASIAPLRTADGGVGIQENLVTRNGPVEKELERMRTLLTRVSARVGELDRVRGRDAMDLDDDSQKAKVNDFLDSFAT